MGATCVSRRKRRDVTAASRWVGGGGGRVHSGAKRLTSTMLKETQGEDNAEVSGCLRAGARMSAAAAAAAGTWTRRC